MLPSWTDLATYLDEQTQHADLQQLTAGFRQMVGRFDIDTFACGKLHYDDRRLNTFFVIDWPDSWLEFYVESGLINRDPIIDALKGAVAPFTWSELRRKRLLTQAGSEAIRGAARHGWTDGLVVPVETSGPVVGLVSLVSRGRVLADEDKAFLTLASYHFYLRAKDIALIKGPAVSPAGLSAREIECLQLIARGCSDRQVGGRLGISTSTAHEHFENAKKKLSGTTRATTIAIAVALAVIQPQ